LLFWVIYVRQYAPVGQKNGKSDVFRGCVGIVIPGFLFVIPGSLFVIPDSLFVIPGLTRDLVRIE